MNIFTKAVHALAARLDLIAAEAERNITRVEAAAVDDWRNDLASVTDSPDGRQAIRDMSITLAQLGIWTSDDLEKMVRLWHNVNSRGITETDLRLMWEYKRTGRRA